MLNISKNKYYYENFSLLENVNESKYIIFLNKKILLNDDYNYVLLFANLEFDINIVAQIDFIKKSCEKNRMYFRNFIIKYKNEIIEIHADSLHVKKKSKNISHIRMINYTCNTENNKIIKTTKFSIASLLYFEIISEYSIEQNHNINIQYFFDSVNSFGALINDSLDYFFVSETL
jgi:hypothetical protein